MTTDYRLFRAMNRIPVRERWTSRTCVRRIVLTGVVLASMGTVVAGAPPEPAWKPPANADDILRYKVQEEASARLRTKIDTAKRNFDNKVRDLGELVYKSGVTAADLEGLAKKIFDRKGTKNPTTNYQEDLNAVVEAAVGDILNAKDVGALKEYVRKVLVQRMVIEVAIKGMEEVNHLMTRGEMDPEEVIKKAHDAAQRRFRQEIDSGRPVKDANALWKTIQQEEFAKVAREWMLETLRKNWGIPREARIPTVEKEVDTRINQLNEFNQELASFVEEEVRDLLIRMKQSKSSDKKMKAELQGLFAKIKAGGVVVSKEQEAEWMAKVKEAAEKPKPPEGGNTDVPTIPASTTPGTQPSGGGGQGGSSRPYSPGYGRGGNVGGGGGGDTSAGTGSQSKPYECQFQIELKMKSENTSDAVITVHLCKPDPKPGTSIERSGVMPPKEIPVRAFTVRDIQAAAKAIQEALESQNGMNLCVDCSHAQAMAALVTSQAPPVRLKCYLYMRDTVFGPVWIEAVRMGVQNTAKNVGWHNVEIQFAGTLQ